MTVVPATATADLQGAPETVSPVEVPPLELMPAPEALTVRLPVVPPLRRWVDETGLHATVGRFVAVRDDAVEIQKANGRLIRVPLERLSEHDRDYVAAAAGAPPEPAAADTVGMGRTRPVMDHRPGTAPRPGRRGVIADSRPAQASSSTATVSKALPSSISRLAPPPVETWLTRSA